jgi:hypothetical protein
MHNIQYPKNMLVLFSIPNLYNFANAVYNMNRVEGA